MINLTHEEIQSLLNMCSVAMIPATNAKEVAAIFTKLEEALAQPEQPVAEQPTV